MPLVLTSAANPSFRQRGFPGRAGFSGGNYCLALLPPLSYDAPMKTLTIRLPDDLVTDIEHESAARRVSKSDVVRERLRQPQRGAGTAGSMRDLIGDLIGSVRNDGLPADLSSKKKKYLPELIRARKRHRR
jgi:hypothetical protein